MSIHDYNASVHPQQHPFASVEEFVESGAARRSSQALGLLRLAGAEPDPGVADDEIAALAQAELERPEALVGITERFEECVFAVARAMGLASIGMWWRVLSAPRSLPVEALPSRVRRAAERAVAADLRLYERARSIFGERTGALAAHPTVERYRHDARARRELPAVLRAVECLRWRQRLGDTELELLRGPAERAP